MVIQRRMTLLIIHRMFVTWLLKLICQTIVPYIVVKREKQLREQCHGIGRKKRKKPFWI